MINLTSSIVRLSVQGTGVELVKSDAQCDSVMLLLMRRHELTFIRVNAYEEK